MPENDSSSHSELASFGDELRREREIRGISLKEIADATKISKRFLEAIERNDHRTLPAPVFTRGFVREYARYLGLAAEEIVSRYNYAAAGDDRIEQSTHLDRLVQPNPSPQRESKGIPPLYARVDRNIYLVIAIVAALSFVAWWAPRFRREARAESIDSVTRSAAAPAPVHVTRTPVKPPPAQPVDDALHLTIVVTEDAWIDLNADGKRVFRGDLNIGDRRSFDAREEFEFKTVGNTPGVTLALNNVPIPPLTGRKTQHNIVFDRAWLRAHAPATEEQTIR